MKDSRQVLAQSKSRKSKRARMSPFIFSASRSAFCACLISPSDTCPTGSTTRTLAKANRDHEPSQRNSSRAKTAGALAFMPQSASRCAISTLSYTWAAYEAQLRCSVGEPRPHYSNSSRHSVGLNPHSPDQGRPLPALPYSGWQLTCVSPAGGSLASSISPIRTTFSPRRTCKPRGISPYWLPTMMRSLAPAQGSGSLLAPLIARQGQLLACVRWALELA